MKNSILFYFALISVFSFHCTAQQNQIATADKQYRNYAYVDAIKTYERIANKGYKSDDVFKKLGNAYYFNSQYEDAAKWYQQLFAMTKNVEPEYFYRYAQSLKATGNTDKATEILEEFNHRTHGDLRAKLLTEDRDYLSQIKANSGRYNINNTDINSKYSDYGTAFYLNKIVFTSARDTGNFMQRKHKWTGEYFTNLYTADLDENFNPANVKKFDKKINTKFHEATPVFTKDGSTVYFTRNNYNHGKKRKDANNTTLVKIYKATLKDNKWNDVTELPFNSDSYSTAHPTLSADEKTLYFASDMPGGKGQSDLYKVALNYDGTFGKPINLGKEINTEGKETFPYITNENELYFASDGHPGLGGLDVFVAKLDENGNPKDVQNVGADINSPKDDFAYIIDTPSRNGFYSSNKEGGNGNDDIYKFLETKKLLCKQELYGVITDQETGIILPKTKVSLFNSEAEFITSTVSDTLGNYSLEIECGKDYNVRAEKTDYHTKELLVTVGEFTGRTNLPIALESSKCKVVVGDDLGKCFGIKMIYFDLDKSNITEAAALDLEKILDVLNENPNMKLDIRSHTDSRATKEYNLNLSERRAESTIKWLVKNGINKSRLTGKGYGESELVNGCSDGVKCSEAEHQMNRRSEFIVTAL
ncbi:OmpA family protein [Flavobacterium agrisoli]|uniref:OmpA family protein n=1 Tax=Flavobacterium agrisoli TaxID=2793066 RepID=A0A934PMS9_9FLAO|nr:OmpA family protein [Flavobacterium agrisoli]MBK0370105.1 OmpA family protein [Flavobacterium agrisoli]